MLDMVTCWLYVIIQKKINKVQYIKKMEQPNNIYIDNYTLITIVCISIVDIVYRDFDQGDIVHRVHV